MEEAMMALERTGEAFEFDEKLTVVGAKLAPGDAVPVELFMEWIDESYRAQAPKKLVKELDGRTGAAPSRAAPAKKRAAPKKKPKKRGPKRSR